MSVVFEKSIISEAEKMEIDEELHLQKTCDDDTEEDNPRLEFEEK